MLTAVAVLIYLTILHMLGLTPEQYISGLYRSSIYTMLIGAYVLSLLALALLWPALKLLQRNLGDYVFSLSLNLLIFGWILAPLLIPLLMAAMSYIVIAIKMPHKLRCLKEKTLA